MNTEKREDKPIVILYKGTEEVGRDVKLFDVKDLLRSHLFMNGYAGTDYSEVLFDLLVSNYKIGRILIKSNHDLASLYQANKETSSILENNVKDKRIENENHIYFNLYSYNTRADSTSRPVFSKEINIRQASFDYEFECEFLLQKGVNLIFPFLHPDTVIYLYPSII